VVNSMILRHLTTANTQSNLKATIMKLIKEIYETVSYELIEEGNGKKSLFIEGPFLVAEKKNKNGRLYEYATMRKEVHRYNEEYINKNRAFGELGHPETPTINLDRVSHMITSLREDGTQWIGKAKILDTPMGTIARQLIEGGAQLGVSSRGMGSLKNVNGVNVVQPDFYLATAADIVADPSAPGAFVQGIMEGADWILENGVWKQQYIEEAKKEIKQASRKDIESIAIKIFENYIKRI